MASHVKQSLSKQAFQAICDDFTRQVEEETPWIGERLVLYSRVTHSFHGRRGRSLDQQSRDQIAQDADAYARKHPSTMAVACTHSLRIEVLSFNDERTSTTMTQPLEREARIALRHEEAHLREKNDFLPEGPPMESYAENYGVTREGGQGSEIADSAEVHGWSRAGSLILEGKRSHFATPAAEVLKGLAQRHDLSQLNPCAAEDLSYRIALEHAPSNRQARSLAYAFRPVQKRVNRGAKFRKVLEKTARITIGWEGPMRNEVFQTGRTFLMPFLDHRTEITATDLAPKFAQRLKLEDGFWTEVRQEIAFRDRLLSTKDEFDLRAQDMRLLGKFDMFVSPGGCEERLEPFAYREALPRLQELQRNAAVIMRNVAQKRPSPVVAAHAMASLFQRMG
jgi:hypothetical protein